MKIYPANLVELIDMFPNEDSCLEYLSKARWPNGYECASCTGKDFWKMNSGLYRCKVCRHTGSVISGTLFQDTHKSLRLWFQAIWYIVSQKHGVNALGLQKALGLGSYHTAWEWLHKLRRAMVRPGRDKLNGNVEVNETFIGGEQFGKRGRGADGKTLVLIAAEYTLSGIGRIRLSPVSDSSGVALKSAIQQMVSTGSTIHTDGWAGYAGLSKLGYIHLPTSNHNIRDMDAVEQTHLIASLLKR